MHRRRLNHSIQKDIVVELLLHGGVGNQLFQLAYLLEKYPKEAKILNFQLLRPRMNADGIPEILNLNLPEFKDIKFGSRSILMKLFKPSFFVRNFLINKINSSYDSITAQFGRIERFRAKTISTISFHKNISFDIEGRLVYNTHHKVVVGYFQKYTFFDDIGVYRIRELIGKCDSIKDGLKLSQINSAGCTLGVHIRRGDYESNTRFGILSLDYYKEALDHVEKLMHINQVIIFGESTSISSDITSFFSSKYCVTLISEHEISSELMTIRKMGECDAFILANSTFSWWGGAMIENQGNVVAPSPWFRANPDFEPAMSPAWTLIPSSFK